MLQEKGNPAPYGGHPRHFLKEGATTVAAVFTTVAASRFAGRKPPAKMEILSP